MKYGYICLGPNGKRMEVRADTLLHARDKAADAWKIPPQKRWKVSAHLCERPDGSAVTQHVD